MNPTQSTNLRRDEESRSTRNEDDRLIMKLRNEEEKLRRRRAWVHQQKLERQHERLKRKMIVDYERKRAEAMQSKQPLYHSPSKSSSKSPSYHRRRERSLSNTSKPDTLFEKVDGSTSGVVPLFKGPGPKSIQISSTELRRIKVDIRRNIPAGKEPVTELQREIVNPEEVILKRREGEGCKPIFERAEIKKAAGEVEEQRTVVAIDGEQTVSAGKLRVSKRRSLSLSPIRNRSYSPGYISYTKYRNAESKHQIRRVEYIDYHKNDRHNNVEKHKKYKDKYTDRDVRRHDSNRSYSRERDIRSSRSIVENRFCRDRYRDKSSERSRERRDRDRDKERDRDRDKDRDRDRDEDGGRNRDRSRDRRAIVPHYVEHVPVPIYYGNFSPRPIMVNPMVTIPRGQVPPLGRGRHPPLMAPVRPFSPRFGPPDIYRMGPPAPNPRYGPMF